MIKKTSISRKTCDWFVKWSRFACQNQFVKIGLLGILKRVEFNPESEKCACKWKKRLPSGNFSRSTSCDAIQNRKTQLPNLFGEFIRTYSRGKYANWSIDKEIIRFSGNLRLKVQKKRISAWKWSKSVWQAQIDNRNGGLGLSPRDAVQNCKIQLPDWANLFEFIHEASMQIGPLIRK